MKRQITLLFISTCFFIFTCNTFGMEISPNPNINQPEDLAALLKRNNELLLLSIQQNHLLAEHNDYITRFYAGPVHYNYYADTKAKAIKNQLNQLYKEHNVNIEIESSAPSASNHSNK